jgi:hypothetical protein
MTEQDRRIADVLSAYEDAIALEDAVKTMGLHDEEVKK